MALHLQRKTQNHIIVIVTMGHNTPSWGQDGGQKWGGHDMSLVCTAALTVLWDDDALCHDGDLCLWSTPSPLPSMILTLGDWVANPLSHSPVCGDVGLAVNGGGGA